MPDREEVADKLSGREPKRRRWGRIPLIWKTKAELEEQIVEYKGSPPVLEPFLDGVPVSGGLDQFCTDESELRGIHQNLEANKPEHDFKAPTNEESRRRHRFGLETKFRVETECCFWGTQSDLNAYRPWRGEMFWRGA